VLYEIRDYHYRRDIFDQYKMWAVSEAIPFLRANLDVIGFWIDSGFDAEIAGTSPIKSNIGTANVTWIIRWKDKETRDRELPRVLSSSGWRDIWSRHPDGGGYLQTSARFMDEA